MIYILIMLIGGSTSQSGYTNIVAEFNTYEACEAARAHVALSVRTTNGPGMIYSYGCYAKGQR